MEVKFDIEEKWARYGSSAPRSRAMLLERMISMESTVCAISRFADISRPRYRLLTVLEGHDHTSHTGVLRYSAVSKNETAWSRHLSEAPDTRTGWREATDYRDVSRSAVKRCILLPVFIIVSFLHSSILYLKSRNDAKERVWLELRLSIPSPNCVVIGATVPIKICFII